jgi:Ca2+-binding RTX toxin-like protein
MGTYTGTSAADTITTTSVSGGVARSPSGSSPSNGADTIYGNGGDDTLNSGGGSDLIYGGDGNDHIYGKTKGLADAGDADRIYGGNGNDVIYGNGGEDDTNGLDGNDTIYGQAGDDRLYGKVGNDLLYGGPGNDYVAGYVGNDTHYGEDGNDFIRGGDGLDHVYGGSGNDTFDYDTVSHSRAGAANRDVIHDFGGVGASSSISDRVDLSTIDARPGGSNDAFTFRGTGGFNGIGQVRVAASGTDTVIQVNTDANYGTAEMEIVVQDGGVPPSQWLAGDFIL